MQMMELKFLRNAETERNESKNDKKEKMDRDLSGARPSALCVCFSYFARAAWGDVVYGLDDRNRAGICGIEKLHISFYRRYRVSAEYYQHDHLDPAAVNGPCVYRNNSGTDLKKAEMVYKLNERGIHDTEYYLQCSAGNALPVYHEPSIRHGK